MDIRINGKEYDVEVADTPEERRRGLKYISKLDDDEGMLFIFDEDGENVSMTMQDTYIPLDQIFINSEGIVMKVVTREPEDDTLVSYKNTSYVLELNANSGVQKGDEIEFIEDDDEASTNPNTKMLVLDEDGEVQMELEGGERIFSRKNTRVLIKMAKRAFITKSTADYKRLGKKLFEFLKTQDTNTPQYVELDKKEEQQ